MTIHAFGAFYGLAASLVLSKPGSGSSHAKNGATYTSDITAMIGNHFPVDLLGERRPGDLCSRACGT